ncbi:MAG: polyphosphate kinase 1 [Oscillospiraceae bacterium]|nr:polyphosphate kinase 1 [Oscillospiraceae bacterium]
MGKNALLEKMVYMNRELSWLKFNERVLEEAENEKNPLCERLSFVSIYQSNLDEFFMVRVGSLIDQKLLDKNIRENKTDLTAEEQLNAVLERVRVLNERKDILYSKLMGRLEEHNVRIVDFRNIDKKENQHLEDYFNSEIVPFLSPVIVGDRQPFPFLKNKEIYAAAVLEKKNGKKKIGIIPCGTGVVPRLIEVGKNSGTYILSEELILHFAPSVFKEYTVKSKSLIRVTRNADIDADALYDEDLDYREFMADIIKRRKRLSPVRMELSRELDGEIVDKLCGYLDIERKYVFRNMSPLDLSFVFGLQDYLRQKSELFYPKRVPQKSAQFEDGTPVLEQIKQGDKLLCYPYDSIKPFLRMLHEAAADKDVVSIKMTLYRVAKNSEVVNALIEAAENGKDVLVLVELKARFDEENNIEWSRRLEEAGCSVIYGLNGYKVHSKLCLITKNKNGDAEYYTQIGTGNYNEKTARLYTDLCLMTADSVIGKDANAVFTALASDTTVKNSEVLLVAPNCLQNRIIEMIDEQITLAKNGEDAYIGVKINSLTDKKIIDELIRASKAGVKIELAVRGICCLIPGIAGETENIRVVSIVGRFLEHSRIYIFGKGDSAKIYIASADFMTRNTIRRVEVAAPIYDKQIREQIFFMFDTIMSDNVQARELKSDGNYVRVENDNEKVNCQELFFDKAYERAMSEK